MHRAKISISNLSFYYGVEQILKNVSLEIQEKQVTAIISPSGCGKSTLLRVLNRMYDLYPSEHATGTVTLDGVDILGPSVDVEVLRSRVGMVFQQPTPFMMSIYDNVAFGAQMFEHLCHADRDARVQESLTRADLWEEVKDKLSEPGGSLSGGQQQRLCIARAIATQPEVILLDEPTGALDPISMAKIEGLIDQLRQTITVAMVTHNMEQAARCADQVAFFYLGELVEMGPPAQIFHAPQQQRTRDYVGGKFS